MKVKTSSILTRKTFAAPQGVAEVTSQRPSRPSPLSLQTLSRGGHTAQSWNEHWVHLGATLRPDMRTLDQMVFMVLLQGDRLGGVEVRLPFLAVALWLLKGCEARSLLLAPALLWDEQE